MSEEQHFSVKLELTDHTGQTWIIGEKDQPYTNFETVMFLLNTAMKRRLNEQGYKTTKDTPSIECNTCHMRSYHPIDIEKKFCGNCAKFHEKPWEYTLHDD